MSTDYGMTCPLKVGDKCRIVRTEVKAERDLIGFIIEVVAAGTVGRSRTCQGAVSCYDTTWCLDILPNIAFARDCLYKLPPDFDDDASSNDFECRKVKAVPHVSCKLIAANIFSD